MKDVMAQFQSCMTSGHAFFEQGRVDDAMSQYREALKFRPDSSSAHCSLGSALIRKKLFSEASAEFKTALDLNPGLVIAYYNLGIALENLGRYQEAYVAYANFVGRAGPEYAKFTEHAKTAQLRMQKSPIYHASQKLSGGKLAWEQGDVINGIYEVRGVLGVGGFGTVHNVYHKGWGTELAVKSPAASILDDKDSMYRFFKEANMWVGLGLHPNIVTCYFVRLLGMPRIFIEFVEGGSLVPKIARTDAPLSLETALDYAVQICRGMEYAHSMGLVHRDLKPGNCLLKADGTLKITDFGLAKAEHQEEDSPAVPTGAGPVSVRMGATQGGLGTPEYMAPEQWTSAGTAGPAADIWAFGVMVYEFCTGVKPFVLQEKETLEAFYARLYSIGWAATPPEQLRADLPQDLAGVIKRCLSCPLDQRPQGFAEIRRELEGLYARMFGRQYPRPYIGAAPLLADTLVNQGVSMADLDRRDEALRLFGEALRMDPTNAGALYNQGLLLAVNNPGSLEGLSGQLAESARMRPWDWLPLYLSGLLAAKRGDTGSAFRFLNGALMQRHGVNQEVLAAVNRLKTSGGASLELGFVNVKPRDAKEEKHNETVFLALVRDAQTRINANQGEAARSLLLKARAVPGYEHYQPIMDLLASVEAKSVPDGINSLDSSGTLTLNSGAVESIALLGDGASCVVASADGFVRLCRLSLGDCGRLIKAHDGACHGVALAGESRAVSVGADGLGKVWDLSTGSNVMSLRGHSGPANCVSVTRDGRFAATGSDDGTVRLWRLSDGAAETTFRGHSAAVTAVGITTCSKHTVSASRDKTLRVWETASGRCVRVLRGHRAAVVSLHVLPDGRHCVSSSVDMSMRLWEFSTGCCLLEFSGQAGRIGAMAVSPDGRFLFAGGVDLRVWDLASGRCLLTVPVAGKAVVSLALSRDGRMLVSGQADESGLLHVWTPQWRTVFPSAAPWHEGALPYLENFLENHRPVAKDGLTRYGTASWTDADFAELTADLQHRGYGWLAPEGVFKKLVELNVHVRREKGAAERMRVVRLLVKWAPVLYRAAAIILLMAAAGSLYRWYYVEQKLSAARAEENRIQKENVDRQLRERLAANMAARDAMERKQLSEKDAQKAAPAVKDDAERQKRQARELALKQRAIDYFMAQGREFGSKGRKAEAIAAYKKVKILSEPGNNAALLAEVEIALGPLPDSAIQPPKPAPKPKGQDKKKGGDGTPDLLIRPNDAGFVADEGAPISSATP